MARRRAKSNPISLFAFQDIITSTTGILILLALVLMLSITSKTKSVESPVQRADEQQLAALASITAEVESLKNAADNLVTPDVSLMAKSSAAMKAKLGELIASNSDLETMGKEKERVVQSKRAALDEEPDEDPSGEELLQLAASIEGLEAIVHELKNSKRIVYNFRKTSRTPWLVQIDDGQLIAAMAGSDKAKKFTSAAQFLRFAKTLPRKQKYVVMIVRPDGIANFRKVKEKLAETGFDLGTELISDTVVAVDLIKGAVF